MKYLQQTNDPALNDQPEQMVQACDECEKEFPMWASMVRDEDRDICHDCFDKEWEAEQESEDE